MCQLDVQHSIFFVPVRRNCLDLREARFLVIMGDRDFDSGESLCEGESLGESQG